MGWLLALWRDFWRGPFYDLAPTALLEGADRKGHALAAAVEQLAQEPMVRSRPQRPMQRLPRTFTYEHRQ